MAGGAHLLDRNSDVAFGRGTGGGPGPAAQVRCRRMRHGCGGAESPPPRLRSRTRLSRGGCRVADRRARRSAQSPRRRGIRADAPANPARVDSNSTCAIARWRSGRPTKPPERWEPFFLQIGRRCGLPDGRILRPEELPALLHRQSRRRPSSVPSMRPASSTCPLPGRDGKPGTSIPRRGSPGAHPGSATGTGLHRRMPTPTPTPAAARRRAPLLHQLHARGGECAWPTRSMMSPFRSANLAAFDLQIRAFIASRRRPGARCKALKGVRYPSAGSSG